MRIKVLLIAAILTGLLLSLSASAQVSCENPQTERVCVNLPIQPISYQEEIDVPKFDPAKGELLSAKMTAQSCGWIVTEVDSEDKRARIFTIVAQGISTATILHSGDELLSKFGTSDAGVQVPLCADDEPGTFDADFAGCDYVKLENGTPSNPICSVIDEDSTWEYSKDAGDDLTGFIRSGTDTTFPVLVDATGDANTPGSLAREIQGGGSMGVEVCVEYVYCPQPIRVCINGSKIDACTQDPIEGWTITLYNGAGAVVATDTTDADGVYSFCDLELGNYRVCEETRDDWTPVGPTCYDVVESDFDGGNVELPPFENTQFCISGYKFRGATGEEGLSGWTIELKQNGAVIDTATTDSEGYYEFCDLTAGTYQVCEVLKDNWKAITPICIDVTLLEDDCDGSPNNNFRNEQPNLVCVCPYWLKDELYRANCQTPLVISADKGILANDQPGSVVVDPDMIQLLPDTRYGSLTVYENGSFIYDPTTATRPIYTGTYVWFRYTADNGNCESSDKGMAKIQISCKR